MHVGFRLIMVGVVVGECCMGLVLGAEDAMWQRPAKGYVMAGDTETRMRKTAAALKIAQQAAARFGLAACNDVSTLEILHRPDARTNTAAGKMVITPDMQFELKPEDIVQWRGEKYRRWKGLLLGPVRGGMQYLGIWRMEGYAAGVVRQPRIRPRWEPDSRDFRWRREFRWRFPPQKPDEKP